jgi:hypothetical protein
MSANLVANVTITGSLTYAGTLSLPYVSTAETGIMVNYIPSILERIPIFYGKVGLGVIPTTQELDLGSDLARKLTTSTWTTGSDARIKMNIETANLVRCAEIIDTVDLKYFEWKTHTEDRHSLGWIAQDVQDVFPNSVVPDSEGVLMLNSDQLIKVLYGALKQTQLEFFSN